MIIPSWYAVSAAASSLLDSLRSEEAPLTPLNAVIWYIKRYKNQPVDKYFLGDIYRSALKQKGESE